MTRYLITVLVACSSVAPPSAQAPRAPRLVFTEVTNSWMPELRCDDGVPGYNKDGAIVLCLHGPINRCPVQR